MIMFAMYVADLEDRISERLITAERTAFSALYLRGSMRCRLFPARINAAVRIQQLSRCLIVTLFLYDYSVLPLNPMTQSRPKPSHQSCLDWSPTNPPPNLHQRLTVLLRAVRNQVLIQLHLTRWVHHNDSAATVSESTQTLPASNLNPFLLYFRRIKNAANQHGPHGDDGHARAGLFAFDDHDAAFVFAEDVHDTRLVDGLRVDGIVCSRDVVDRFDFAVYGGVPS